MQALKNVSVSSRDVNKFVYDLFLTAEQQDHMKLRTSIYSADKEVISTKTQNKVIAVLDTIEKVLVKNYIEVVCYGFIME